MTFPRRPAPILCPCPDCHGEGDRWVDASLWVADGNGGFDLDPAQDLEPCETCGGGGFLGAREYARLIAAHLVKADRWAWRRMAWR